MMGVCTGTFQFPNGSPVANGQFQFKLSQDAIEVSTACIAPTLINGNLDPSGNLTSTFLFNDVLSTVTGPTTTYQLTVKSNGGGQVWNESYYLTGTAANLNLILPSGPVPPVLINSTATTTVTVNLSAANFTATGAAGFISSGLLNPQAANGVSVSNTNNLGTVAGQIPVWQFGLVANYAVRHATIMLAGNAGTTTATALCSFAIYDVTGANKLVDTGVFTVTWPASATALSNAITAVTLTAGTYLFAETANNNNIVNAIIGVPGGGGTGGLVSGLMNKNVVRFGIASATSSAGVMPSTLGALTAVSQSNAEGMGFCFFEP